MGKEGPIFESELTQNTQKHHFDHNRIVVARTHSLIN